MINKKGDLSNLIFVMLVLITCIVALTHFLKFDSELQKNLEGVYIQANLNSKANLVEQYYSFNAYNLFLESYSEYLQKHSVKKVFNDKELFFLDFSKFEPISDIYKNNLPSLNEGQQPSERLAISNLKGSEVSFNENIFLVRYVGEDRFVEAKKFVDLKMDLSGKVSVDLIFKEQFGEEFFSIGQIKENFDSCLDANNLVECMQEKMRSFNIVLIEEGQEKYLDFNSKNSYLIDSKSEKISFRIYLDN